MEPSIPGHAFKLSVIRYAAFGPDKSGNGNGNEYENEDEDSVNMRFLPVVFPAFFCFPRGQTEGSCNCHAFRIVWPTIPGVGGPPAISKMSAHQFCDISFL